VSSNTVQSGVMTEIRQGQVSTLFRKTTLGFWGNIVLAAIYSAFFVLFRPTNGDIDSDSSLNYLFIWLVLLVAVCLYRRHITKQFDPNEHREPTQLALWANKHILLTTVINTIWGMLMELRDSQSSLRKQANTDTLTQIANRRYFDQTFKNEWRRTTRDGIPISMLLVDIDFFSVGVSCCVTPDLDGKADDEEVEVMYPAMLMNAADNAMFLAKQQGRNRVAEQKCGEQRLAQVLQKYAAKEASRT